MTYPISNQQQNYYYLIYQTNKEKQTNENKLIGRIIKMDRHVCSGFDLQSKSHVNLLPQPSDFTRTAGWCKGYQKKKEKEIRKKARRRRNG